MPSSKFWSRGVATQRTKAEWYASQRNAWEDSSGKIQGLENQIQLAIFKEKEAIERREVDDKHDVEKAKWKALAL
jgi:hypothetical protein